MSQSMASRPSMKSIANSSLRDEPTSYMNSSGSNARNGRGRYHLSREAFKTSQRTLITLNGKRFCKLHEKPSSIDSTRSLPGRKVMGLA